jgi:hypothetical protein
VAGREPLMRDLPQLMKEKDDLRRLIQKRFAPSAKKPFDVSEGRNVLGGLCDVFPLRVSRPQCARVPP